MRNRSLGRQPTMEEIAAAAGVGVSARARQRARPKPASRALNDWEKHQYLLDRAEWIRSQRPRANSRTDQALARWRSSIGRQLNSGPPYFSNVAKPNDKKYQQPPSSNPPGNGPSTKCADDAKPGPFGCECWPGDECCSAVSCASTQKCVLDEAVGGRVCKCHYESLPKSGEQCQWDGCGCKDTGTGGCKGDCWISFPFYAGHDASGSCTHEFGKFVPIGGPMSHSECAGWAIDLGTPPGHPCLSGVMPKWTVFDAKCK